MSSKPQMNGEPLRVLSLQPWHGGSHLQFSDGWTKRSKHNWTTLGLPDHNWKWRMRHSAIDFAKQVCELSRQGESWDVVFCTDMMNAAEFQSLARPIRELPMVVYFHENQFAYPLRGKQQPDHHFLFTNYVSALAAEEVWLNSRFNLDSMLRGIEEQAKGWPEFSPQDEIKTIESKSRIVPPPISFPESELEELTLKRKQRVESGEPLHLVWAARWEYDKNPDELLKCLELLQQQRVPFRLSVIGQQADVVPPAFAAIRKKFELQIENWAWQESRDAYWSVLQSADVFLSTANHEFFGLSVAEAIAAGAWPLLPQRLAYPELLEVDQTVGRQESFFYQSTAKDLAAKIRQLHNNRNWDFEALSSLAQSTQQRLDFERCAKTMDQMLLDVCS